MTSNPLPPSPTIDPKRVVVYEETKDGPDQWGRRLQYLPTFTSGCCSQSTLEIIESYQVGQIKSDNCENIDSIAWQIFSLESRVENKTSWGGVLGLGFGVGRGAGHQTNTHARTLWRDVRGADRCLSVMNRQTLRSRGSSRGSGGTMLGSSNKGRCRGLHLPKPLSCRTAAAVERLTMGCLSHFFFLSSRVQNEFIVRMWDVLYIHIRVQAWINRGGEREHTLQNRLPWSCGWKIFWSPVETVS